MADKPKYIKFPVKGDDMGEYIFDADMEMVCQMRGWGHLHTAYGVDEAVAEQKRVQDFIVAAMNEKHEREEA